MKKREISSILSRASGKDVAEIAAPLKESGRVEVLKEPQKTLVMIKVRESVGRSLFYLGELLATECMVRVNGSKGFSVMAGDDFEKTFHAAVIDGYLNSDDVFKDRHVIEAIAQTFEHPGLEALLEEVGLAGKPVTAENVSYAIAPRINAAGRMDNAVTALQLVMCEDPDRAAELAHKLNEINTKRQETELQIFKAAQELLEQEPERLEDRVMLLWGRDWHPGVIGIVASRLVERTGRPVIVVTIDEHGECKGSGRSVQGFNLHACIGACADLLIRYGGHAMAAGLSVREENLPALRRRLNDWAARECPVLHTTPLECDLPIHLDRVTVESVRKLDQLAPYGAENPTPVFLLQNAVLDGVYPVSEGRHSRLRLRQGNASVYAVWFGMPPEQLPYAMGDVVDAALNLSVYDSPRGAQLSGRILDLHPAGLGTKLAEQAAFVVALRRGTPLTVEQKKLITPERSDIVTVYRELQARRWHAEDLQPLCAKLGEENTGKTLVAVTALEQVGLIAAVEKGGAKYLELVPAQGKKNLADAPVLKCLEGM